MILIKCHHVTVRPLLSSPDCSEQMLVQDEEGHRWRMHASNRLLTDHGVKVPCDILAPMFAFRTEEGNYIQQRPALEGIAFNFTSTSPSTLPSFLQLEEDKLLFPPENPFQEPDGLYTEKQLQGQEDTFLREWSLIVGTPPEALLTLKEPSPPASAAASAHARAYSSTTSETALRSVEDFISSMFTWGLGRLLSKVERLALTLVLMAGNLFGCMMLLNKLITFFVHIGGCFGVDSTLPWREALGWAFCSSCSLAARARKGFQSSPSALSAPPHSATLLSSIQPTGAGGARAEGPSVKPTSEN